MDKLVKQSNFNVQSAAVEVYIRKVQREKITNLILTHLMTKGICLNIPRPFFMKARKFELFMSTTWKDNKEHLIRNQTEIGMPKSL